ncbi:hypothetical protein [Streptomyces fuscichromogenes]|uniref:Uncharacterized protein n=1 Tax=Streptomyces fuscichromogenes TaxID=1324013 RepID=A0A917XES1_9ACTN|nr:hypothetical protein [Streptomyces fuscichromogenes]GGN14465.1 hypothetical protein GCM10011578_042170 [Streptomyces fuscichromogenes]
MTQSGQGEPAREGIVLPSDGGEPLLPGMTGSPVPVAQPPAPAAAPSEGRSWGQPWGPGHQQSPQPDPAGQGWPQAAGQEWESPEPPQLPPAWTAQSHAAQSHAAQAQAVQAHAPGAGALPPEGAPAPSYGGGYDQSYGYGAPPQQSYGAPLPPAAGQDPYGAPGAALPPAVPQGGHGGYGGGLPPADEGATQFLPPVPAAPVDEGATQYIPSVPAASEGATQLIPPVGAGALPPEMSHGQTAFHGGAAAPAHSDADATQYIPPYPAGGQQGGDRQPPAEFDSLFRSTPGGEPPAAATAYLPRFQEQPQSGYQQPPAYTPPPTSFDHGDADDGRSGRGRSKVPLIAAVGVGIAVLGIGAGALLSGSGGDSGETGKTVAASASAGSTSSAAAGDPAKAQAVALDKLLADSGSSRASVINAVARVKQCQNLDGSASDLRNAAQQRTELVTRLSKLSVDKLPANAELSTALTKAWQASANADSHYAAWADQVKGKHGCRKGQARSTGQTAAGNQESGTASSQKVKAAALWNTIASKYGLTQRQPTQL